MKQPTPHPYPSIGFEIDKNERGIWVCRLGTTVRKKMPTGRIYFDQLFFHEQESHTREEAIKTAYISMTESVYFFLVFGTRSKIANNKSKRQWSEKERLRDQYPWMKPVLK